MEGNFHSQFLERNHASYSFLVFSLKIFRIVGSLKCGNCKCSNIAFLKLNPKTNLCRKITSKLLKKGEEKESEEEEEEETESEEFSAAAVGAGDEVEEA